MLGLLLLQVLASCPWLGHSEVVTSFEDCSQYFYEATTPNDILRPSNAAWICQRYRNQYHYATLYDRDGRIPVYSAYIYQPGPGSNSPVWFVEPQLINQNYGKDMDTEESIEDEYTINLEQIGQSQATNEDYNNLQNLEKCPLAPSGQKTGDDSKWATFTLTNTVPLNSGLHQVGWRDYMEKTMAQKTQGCDTTYVITGAVPGNTNIPNGRVNVPKNIWSAACCLVGNNPTRAWGAIAYSERNHVEHVTLGQLENWLTNLYKGRMVTLFNNACPRQ
ncbi:endonuclease domain-containing 1 protein-like [Oenanthe melanoleuca]|uniref:endonuclease domain-containing 1 protein-like n=1 Tax=Oenanthe melanoleuca TaxID=2939378 RepID=UPI0024C1E85B|nr:endonuclease domain-containing 1 protein-like [Oenanthe melanoleuca]